jgi:DNA-binding transcriptional MerR regulator
MDTEASGAARANGRVRDVPNERLVRWYVTVGLVDPPLSRRGRVARYGRRHLLQLVAVKRRQAEGRSLAEIQAELAGATNEALAVVARIPDTWPAPEAPATAPGRFWTRQPGQAEVTDAQGAERTPGAERAADAQGAKQAAGAAVRQRAGRAGAAGEYGGPAGGGVAGPAGGGVAGPAGGIVRGVRLARGVTLLLEDADHELSPDEVAEIVSAARPLLEELANRRLRADHLEERHDH